MGDDRGGGDIDDLAGGRWSVNVLEMWQAPDHDEMIERYGFELGESLYQIRWRRWLQAENEMIDKLAVDLETLRREVDAIRERECNRLGEAPREERED